MKISLEKFCTVSQTYQRHSQDIDPYPWQPESHDAIALLFDHILDPIIDYFGKDRFILTYGFCSVDLRAFLEKKDPITGIKNGRAAPQIDQHMAHEVNRNGKYYCDRLGAAADFYIQGLNSAHLTSWIIDSSLPFDSLYYYGSQRPIHLSYGPQHKRKLWKLTIR